MNNKTMAWLIGLVVLMVTLYSLDNINKDLGTLYIFVVALGFILVNSQNFTEFFSYIGNVTGSGFGPSSNREPGLTKIQER